MIRTIIGSLFVAVLVSPALAADEYWVKYDYTTHTCSVVEKKSSDTTEAGKDSAATNNQVNATSTDPQSNSAATGTAKDDANAGDSAEKSDDPTAAVADAWKRKEATAKESHQDITTALIGSPMKSQQEAEEEMQIMRKCGLHN